ncbi:extracellular solute-binding protein [Zestomonas carbonaria]|uniref:Spermidine-binding periplasmic protein SpuE n=1 Tax=Zestomonas carbonaria TaxID=2762745 RepID=A0A7U7I8T8_9GAMM|nr:extracellular solute-binding protein [Pseudomonas carbonaria]CAD5107679.1 Spermidine-binding periplasmic protein SpuE [Pseudomonas carbonaria]
MRSFLVMLLALGMAAQAEERRVWLPGGAQRLPAALLAGFEAESGIRVAYSETEADLALLSAAELADGIGQGRLQPVRRFDLPHYGHLDPALLGKLADVDLGNQYGVPYAWSTLGLVHDRAALAERLPRQPADSLDLLFHPGQLARLADCGAALGGTPQEVLQVTLHYLGHAPHTSEFTALEEARLLLREVQQHLRRPKAADIGGALASGELCLALLPSDQAGEALRRAGGRLGYALPREGSLIDFQVLAIPRDARHPREAHALIDYLLRPEVMAVLGEQWRLDGAGREPRGATALALTEESLRRGFVEQAQEPLELRRRERLWASLRSRGSLGW